MHQIARYSAVSCVSTVTSMVVLGVLVGTGSTSAAWANVIATAVGTIPSFELNRRWVWRAVDRRSMRRQVLPFVGLSFAGLALSTLAVAAASAWATAAGLSPTMQTVVVEVANVGSFGVLWIIQFVILDRILFRHRGVGVPPVAT